MSYQPSLVDWNHQVLMLTQAMIGAITPNFRLITLSFINNHWFIEFYFEDDNDDDKEEVEAILVQYEAYQDNSLKYNYAIYVIKEILTVYDICLDKNVRIIYKRKEFI